MEKYKQSNNQQKVQSLLSSIFYQDEYNNNIIIKNGEKIPELLSYIYSPDNSNESKYLVLNSLYSSFDNIRYSLEIFSNYTSIKEDLTFFEILIAIYLNDEEKDEIYKKVKEKAFNILELLLMNITCPRRAMEFLNGEIRKYIPNHCNLNINQKLSKEKFKNYLQVLRLCYNIGDINIKIVKDDTPNYFYFTGQSSIEIRRGFFKLDPGFSISLWIKISLDSKVLNSIFKQKSSTLLNLKLNSEENSSFSFIIDKDNNLISSLSNEALFHFSSNKLYNIIFNMQNSFKDCSEIEVYIDGLKINFYLENFFSKKKEIEIITLLKNFFGICTSILIFNGYATNVINCLYSVNMEKKFPLGIYSEEQFTPFINPNDLLLPGQKIKKTESNIYLREAVRDLLAVYMPTRIEYNENNKLEFLLKDTKRNFDAIFKTAIPNTNGVHIYQSIIERIDQFGGISNLLPIIEIMTKNEVYSDNMEEINTPDSLDEIFCIIANLLSGEYNEPIKEAEKSNFFFCLSLFLENLPNELFDKGNLINYFKSLSNSFVDSINSKLIEEFYLYIFLNEKILLNFPLNEQGELLDQILKLSEQEDEECKDNKMHLFSSLLRKIEIGRIIKILLHYDREKYNKFCCREHADFFIGNNKKIIQPEMNIRLNKFKNLVIKILKTKPIEEIATFFQMLTLELSPCVQLFVINCFEEIACKMNIKNYQVIENIMKTILFALSFSHLSVRIELINTFFTFNSNTLISLEDRLSYGKQLEMYFFPEFFTIDSNCDSNANDTANEINERDRITYNKVNIIKGKRQLSDLYDEKAFNLTCISLVLTLLAYFKGEEVLIKNVINCMVTLSLNSEISIASTILKNIRGQIEEEYEIRRKIKVMEETDCGLKINALISNHNFINFILEMAFQAFLATKKPDYKSPFKIKLVNLPDRPEQEIYIIAREIMKELFSKNIFLMNNILNWGAYYKTLFESSQDLYKLLMEFMKNIIKEVKDKFFDRINKSNKNEFEIEDDKLYFFTCLFEFATFYKKDNMIENASENNIMNKLLLLLKSPSNDNINQLKDFDLLDDFFNYYYIPDIYKIIDLNHKDIFNYHFDKFQKDKSGYNLCQLLFYPLNEKQSNNEYVMIPLIVLLFNIFALKIDVSEGKVLESLLEKYEKLLKSLIILSTLMKFDDKDKEKNIRYQDNFKIIIYFGILFLFNQIEKKKDIHILLKTLKRIADLCIHLFEKCNSKVENQKREKEQKKFFSFKKIDYSFLEKCSLYRLFNDLKSDKKNFDSIKSEFEKLKKNNEYEIQRMVMNGETFKSIFYNQSLMNEIEKIFFCFTQIYKNRKNKLKNIIPCYNIEEIIKNNNINYDIHNNKICLSSRKDFLPANFHVAQIKKQISNLIEIYEINEEVQYYSKVRAYIKVKKKLFTFNGVWSDKDQFYLNKLTLKLVNHNTRDLTRIFLTPVINLNSYLPYFNEYIPNSLFHCEDPENTKVYNLVDLNLFNIKDLKEKGREGNSNIKFNPFNEENQVKYNILYYMYKENFAPFYSENQNENYSQELFEVFLDNKLNLIKKDKDKDRDKDKDKKSSFKEKCCLITKKAHIKGYYFQNDSHFGFYAYDYKPKVSDEDYDADRNACFGSVFRSCEKQKTFYNFKCEYNQIEAILKRSYFFRKNCMEIFIREKKSFFFKFSDMKKRDTIIKNLKERIKAVEIQSLNSESNTKIGYANKNIDNNAFESLDKKYSKWREWEISTFEMIMYLNSYSSRTNCDIMQYPVLPWIIMDYESKEIPKLDKEEVLRPFHLPMGMITKKNLDDSFLRQKGYLEHYVSMKREEEKKRGETPFFYGSHYSNALYTVHYLVRVFPFAFMQIELQGKSFDDPNRLFNSLKKSFNCAITQKCDVRELIPEFFCMPEMFYNLNDLNLGNIKSSITKALKSVQNVSMPEWSKDGYTFVKQYRQFLESEEVGTKVNNWFDLIFGYKQKGKKAEEANNIFCKESYEDFEKVFDKMNVETKNYSIRMVEFGVTPNQILSSSAAQRHKLDDVKKIYGRLMNLKDGDDEICGFETLKMPSFSINIFQESEKIMVVTCSYNQVKYYEWKKLTSNKKTEGIDYGLEEVKQPKEISSNILYRINSKKRNPVMTLYSKGAYIAVGGFWNGRVLLLSRKSDECTLLYDVYIYSPILVIKIDDENNLAFCGNKQGIVKVYSIDKENKTEWKLITLLNDHTMEITDICISQKLNIICTTGKDGLIMVYTLPGCKLINSFKLEENEKNAYVSKCLISSCPLPCFVFYVGNIKKPKIYRYSINNTESSNNDKNGNKTNFIETEVISWRLFRNAYFQEYIVYSLKVEMYYLICVRALPDLSLQKQYTFSSSRLFDFDVSPDGNFLMFLEEQESNKQNIIVLKEKEYQISIS